MSDPDKTSVPTPEQRRLVEEFGLFLEQQGGTRMSGRIAGWLLLCTPPVQSLTAISESLTVSKGAASEAARLLVQMGILERVSEPGRRGDSYRACPQALDRILRVETATALRELLDRCLTTVTDTDPPQPNHILLRDLRDFHAFLERELPALLDRWQRQRANISASSPTTPALSADGAPEQESA